MKPVYVLCLLRFLPEFHHPHPPAGGREVEGHGQCWAVCYQIQNQWNRTLQNQKDHLSNTIQKIITFFCIKIFTLSKYHSSMC